jgi:DNA-directed RNA polymerase subunit M
MEFCEKCGSIILVTKDKTACAACGHKVKGKVKIEASEKMAKHDTIAVINEEADNTYPVIDMVCPKCKNKKAYFWTSQTRAADESETKFYKCTKCKHTWRKYR